MFDTLIQGGQIVDGTGSPWFPGDVGIAGDRIAAIGNLAGAKTCRRIDAAGKIVCPGFVDAHAHSDLTILANRGAVSSLYQGVTTEIAGQCGISLAPVAPNCRALIERSVASTSPGVQLDWTTCADFLERVAEGTAINIGIQAAHGMLRRVVLGMENRRPTEDELRALERVVAEALDAGMLGLSFGLEYFPGSAAEFEELRRLCAVAAARGKLTSWHVRNRDRHFVEAIEEALAATQQAGAALQLAHLSAKPGSSPRAWNRVMELVRLARAQGQDVQCDMIPYGVGPGLLSAILPAWATQGSPAEITARLRDPQARQKMMADCERYWLLFYYRQWDKLTLAASRAHPEWIGLTFREIGQAAGKDPFECVYDLLADEGEGRDNVWINGVLFTEGDVGEWIQDPLFSIASDGLTTRDSGPWRTITNHPGSYGWAPRVIETYVRERRTLRLEEAIRKMTSQPAARWGLLDRGVLRAGLKADVIVFDAARFRTRATYARPHIYAEGMEYVFVNGRLAFEAGAPTGILAGETLRR